MSNDFTNFKADIYLEEYYKSLGEENQMLLRFFYKAYKKIGKFETLLEIGGGPTVWQLISASKFADLIIFSEFSKDCREEVIRFLKNESKHFDWKDYIEFVAKLEKPKSESNPNIESRVRKSVKSVVPIDIRKDTPLSPNWFPKFDVVSMGAVAETIAETEKQFINYMKNSIQLLRKGGYFVGYFSKNCKKWTHGDTVYQNFPVDEEYVCKFFEKNGFEIIENSETVGVDYEQDYQGVFGLLAKR